MDGVKVALGNRNDCEGCASMHEIPERVESPGRYVTERVSLAIFAWPCILLDRPPMLWWLSPGEGWVAVT